MIQTSQKRLPAFRKPDARRSRNMRAIRSSQNRTTERRLVSLLRGKRVRGWKLHPRGLQGKPDLVIPSKHIAVFVDGCFWHGCPRCGHIPKTNRAYWRAKIARNKKTDLRSARQLREEGYRVVRIWECQLKMHPDNCLRRILAARTGDQVLTR
jgi:DNA mismatch endonuclease (patch repair protein)